MVTSLRAAAIIFDLRKRGERSQEGRQQYTRVGGVGWSCFTAAKRLIDVANVLRPRFMDVFEGHPFRDPPFEPKRGGQEHSSSIISKTHAVEPRSNNTIIPVSEGAVQSI